MIDKHEMFMLREEIVEKNKRIKFLEMELQKARVRNDKF